MVETVRKLGDFVNLYTKLPFKWKNFRKTSRILDIIPSDNTWNGGSVTVPLMTNFPSTISIGRFLNSSLLQRENLLQRFVLERGTISEPKLISQSLVFDQRDLIEIMNQYTVQPGLKNWLSIYINLMRDRISTYLDLCLSSGGILAKAVSFNTPAAADNPANNEATKFKVDRIFMFEVGMAVYAGYTASPLWQYIVTSVDIDTQEIQLSENDGTVYRANLDNNDLKRLTWVFLPVRGGHNLAKSLANPVNPIINYTYKSDATSEGRRQLIDYLPNSIPSLLANEDVSVYDLRFTNKLHTVDKNRSKYLRACNADGSGITFSSGANARFGFNNLDNFIFRTFSDYLRATDDKTPPNHVLISPKNAGVLRVLNKADQGQNVKSGMFNFDGRGLSGYNLMNVDGHSLRIIPIDSWPDDNICIINPQTFLFLTQGGVTSEDKNNLDGRDQLRRIRAADGSGYLLIKDMFIYCELLCLFPYGNIIIHSIPTDLGD